MIRKYHNHTLLIYQRHRKEEPRNNNNHNTPGKQTKQSNQLCFLHQDDCKTRNETMYYKTHNPTMGATINIRITSWNGQQPGCLNAFYWYQIFAIYSFVVKMQTLLSLHGGFLTITMYFHRKSIKSNLHTMKKQRKGLTTHR